MLWSGLTCRLEGTLYWGWLDMLLQRIRYGEAHIGGVVEVDWVLGAWLPLCGCLDLHYPSFGSTSALNIGNVPGQVIPLLKIWSERLRLSLLSIDPLLLLLHFFRVLHPPPRLGPHCRVFERMVQMQRQQLS